MVRLREIPRTAAFAWSPGAAKPLLVTGTRAGAVDADFSDETKLELWDLNLDSEQQALELQPIASISTDSRFYDIAWGPASDEHPRGIIAGALENGSLDLWDAEKLISGAADAAISRTSKHTGAIKSLQFNPLKPQILATAGTKGELFIYDINDVQNPFRLGTAAARSDDLECVAWNRKVPHILATGGSGGFVTVWDLKTKKASLTLNNSRKAVSAIAWDPNNSTKLLTATPDDNMPVIFLWDLRNSNAPERTLQGHEQGVLSLSWCEQDGDLLLSCGKDNRTLVWNPQTGERYGEFPEVTNWTFSTRFNPANPNLSATASFDGKITIQTLQNTNPATTQAAAQNNLDGEDFFTKAQTQPQGASFTLKKAPKWYQRPVGASFGFGGKIVVFRKNATPAGQPGSSRVAISQFSVDSGVGTATEKFAESLRSGDIKSICESHYQDAKTDDERADWKVMETLLAENPRSQVIDYLGLSSEADDVDGADQGKEGTSEVAKEGAPAGMDEDLGLPKTNESAKKHKKNRLSMFFADGGDADFLSELAAAKGAKTDNPFHLLRQGNTSLEDRITKALMLGNFSKAVEVCLEEERIADAFLIANCGGKELVDKVQAAYISQKKGKPSYLRLLGSVIAENLWDVVYNADLDDWKETMATLCTFAKPTEFPDLCEALGDRLMESSSASRTDASFCYLIGSKLDKVVDIWVAQLEEAEQAEVKQSSAAGDSTFSVHARLLQSFIEKVTVFRHVTKFSDPEATKSSDWKLSSLYDKYSEYADVVAGHGHLAVAQQYLDLVPSAYPAAEAARNRIKLATQKPGKMATQASAAVGGVGAAASRGPVTAAAPRSSSRQLPVGYQQHTSPYGASPGPQVPALTPAPAANPYAPQPAAAASPYAPAAATPYQPTQASSAYAPPQTGGTPAAGYGSSSGYGPPQPAYGAMAPPPRNQTPVTAPPRNLDAGSWNDVPLVTKAPARRATPNMAAITTPLANSMNVAPPPASPYGSQRGAPTPPPPPPPKASGPPRVASPLVGPPQAPARPPSAAAASYAPPPAPGQGLGMGAPPMTHAVMPPRTASPYNMPTSTAPPSNRYAPAPALGQQSGPSPPGAMAPPPSLSRPPPAGSFSPAPPQLPPTGNGPFPPSPYQPAAQPLGGPPAGVGASQPPPPPSQSAASPVASAPPARHPPGDRSHIPEEARRLVDILQSDMQRVSSKAPQSFAPQVKDTQKRLNILFDHLNNGELIRPDTIEKLSTLAAAIESRNYDAAQRLQVDIQKEKTEECGQWMVGVKRLISMSKATP